MRQLPQLEEEEDLFILSSYCILGSLTFTVHELCSFKPQNSLKVPCH